MEEIKEDCEEKNECCEHFVCHICGTKLKTKLILKQHLTLTHPTELFTCDVCNKSFKVKWILRKHMLIHSGQEPYACQHCPRKFVRFQPFKKHVAAHRGIKNFKCDLCNSKFTHKWDYQRHLKTIHENPDYRKYVCFECGASFKTSSHLNRHSNIHLPQKPFVCQFCGKQCTQASNLKIHIMGVHKDLSHLVYEKKVPPYKIDPSSIVIPKYEDFKKVICDNKEKKKNIIKDDVAKVTGRRKYIKSNKYSKKNKNFKVLGTELESHTVVDSEDASLSLIVRDEIEISVCNNTEVNETNNDSSHDEPDIEQEKAVVKVDFGLIKFRNEPLKWDDNDDCKLDLNSSNSNVAIKQEPKLEEESSNCDKGLFQNIPINFVDVKMENFTKTENDFSITQNNCIKIENNFKTTDNNCRKIQKTCSKKENNASKTSKCSKKECDPSKTDNNLYEIFNSNKIENDCSTVQDCKIENTTSPTTSNVMASSSSNKTSSPSRSSQRKYKPRKLNKLTPSADSGVGEDNSNASEENTKKSDLRCKHCNEKFSRKKMVQHLRDVHRKCKRCERVFNTVEELDEHCMTYCCRFCDESFKTLAASIKHRKDDHGIVNLDYIECVCNLCGKKISCKRNLSTHMKSVHSDRPYACHECPKTFTDEKMLKLHLSIHSGEEPFKCEYCTKKFIFFQNWRRHVKAHVNTKSFMCHICSKQFQSQDRLNEHIRCVHINIKKYKCSVCGAAFPRNYRLKVHMRIHSVVKPYKCQFCGKECTQASNLKIHIMGVHRDVSHLVYKKTEEIKQVAPESIIIPVSSKDYFKAHPESNILITKETKDVKDSRDGSVMPEQPQTSNGKSENNL